MTSQLAQTKPLTIDNPARAAAFINWPVLYAEMDRLRIDALQVYERSHQQARSSQNQHREHYLRDDQRTAEI